MSPELQRRRGGRPRKVTLPPILEVGGTVYAHGYIRVSTSKQADEGTSLKSQAAAIERYCEAQGWVLGAIFVDAGVSGSQDSRPGLDGMLQNLDGVQRVVALKIDRLGRSTKHMLDLYERLERRGVGIVSVREQIDTSTPVGRLMRTILVALSELERETIHERTSMGRRVRAEETGYCGGRVPYGYRLSRVDGRHVWEIEPSEAAVVQRIHTWRQTDDLSLPVIASKLESQAVISPSGGTRWHPMTVQRILENPVYRGTLVYSKGRDNIAVPVPAIIY